jgi:hypothetical protein
VEFPINIVGNKFNIVGKTTSEMGVHWLCCTNQIHNSSFVLDINEWLGFGVYHAHWTLMFFNKTYSNSYGYATVVACINCLEEILYETCFRHECNWNTVHVTLINIRSKLALLGPYLCHLFPLDNLCFANFSSLST